MNRTDGCYAIAVFLVLLVMAACFVGAGIAKKPDSKFTEPSEYRFRLDKAYVVDGDTLGGNLILPYNVVLRDQRVRLIGIDAWEPRGDEKEKGDAATEFVKEIVRSGTVWLVPVLDGERDNFGRLKACVYVSIKGHYWIDVAGQLKKHGHTKPD